MPKLLDLPNETLSEVVSWLHHSRTPLRIQNLRSISMVCHRLRDLARPFIFQDLYLSSSKQSSRMEMARQTIQAKPEIAALVRSIRLSWQDGDTATHQTINDILSSLLQLHSLWLHADAGDADSILFPHFLRINHMQALKEITISYDKMSVEHLAYYMFIRSAITVNVDNLNTYGSTALPKALNSRTCNVTTLRIRPIINLTPTALQTLLQWTPKLRKLSCSIPGENLPYWRPGSGHIETHYTVSPKFITQILQSVRSTLEELDFRKGVYVWLRHDGTRMNLSTMSTLKRLTCPSSFLFAPESNSPWTDRNGVFELLPKPLEMIQIDFQERQYLVSLQHKSKEDSEILLQTQQTLELSWLKELAAMKAKSCPSLREIDISEFMDPRCGSHNWRTPWTPPKAIEEALCNAGIDHWLCLNRSRTFV